MELSSREAEIPIPINSTPYGGEHGNGHGHEVHGNMAHHHHNHLHQHHHDPSNGSSNLQDHHHEEDEEEDHGGPYMNKKKKKRETTMIRYRECLKNHAASMGGNSLDGCGEFMPSGEEGTLEALTCSACNCHRNFHRKEVQGQTNNNPPHHAHPSSYYKFGRKFFFGDHRTTASPEQQALMGYPTRTVPPTPQPHQMILPYNVGPTGPMPMPMLPSESDEQEDVGFVSGGGLMVMSNNNINSRPPGSSSHHHEMGMMKKRFRTKFTQEQKEKMLDFAERVGWKIQKQEESVVQQFCQEIGVRRRVLKVWMHNNKHNLAKKIHLINNNNPPPPPSSPPPPTTSTTETTTLVS